VKNSSQTEKLIFYVFPIKKALIKVSDSLRRTGIKLFICRKINFIIAAAQHNNNNAEIDPMNYKCLTGEAYEKPINFCIVEQIKWKTTKTIMHCWRYHLYRRMC